MEAPPRPKLYLAEYGRRYPHVWRAVDALRAQRSHDIADWPPWCFLPLGWVFALVTNGSNRISPEALQDIGALAPWRVTQGVYRFDPALYAALADTRVSGDLPCELLYRLPEWCVYIETPGMHWMQAPAHGFFAHLEHDANTGRVELRLVIDLDRGLQSVPLHLGEYSLETALARALEVSAAQARSLNSQGQAAFAVNAGASTQSALHWLEHGDLVTQMRACAEPLISLLLYLCSENADIGGRDRARSTPQPNGPRADPDSSHPMRQHFGRSGCASVPRCALPPRAEKRARSGGRRRARARTFAGHTGMPTGTARSAKATVGESA